MTSETELYRAFVRDAMQTDCAALTADAACRDAVLRLREGEGTCIVVTDTDRRPVGILTEQDIARRIAFQAAPETPVAEVMSAPVTTIHADEFLFHAIARMRRGNIRHMPVVDGAGVLAGVLRLRDALLETDRALMADIDALSGAIGVDGLIRVKDRIWTIAARLLADGVPVPEIQALVTEAHNDVYRRTADLIAEEMAEAGLGGPPVAFAVIVMGSGGRGENFIRPDQDNGLILADYPDAEHDDVDRWFIDFSERLTLALDRIGFPLCRGHVMATNPVWRKSIGQWKRQVGNWIARRTAVSLRLCDILFDFRAVWGEPDLAQDLRRHILTQAAANPAFLRQLVAESESAGVALGFFDRFILVRGDELHQGTINLKQSGILPLIEAVRLVALREGLPALSTLGRMDELKEAGYLDRDEHDYLTGAYHHLSTLILRHQVKAAARGAEVSYYVPPDALTRREKDMLVDGLKAIRRLRDRVRAELTGAIF